MDLARARRRVGYSAFLTLDRGRSKSAEGGADVPVRTGA